VVGEEEGEEEGGEEEIEVRLDSLILQLLLHPSNNAHVPPAFLAPTPPILSVYSKGCFHSLLLLFLALPPSFCPLLLLLAPVILRLFLFFSF
jgi:hypothetical protein